MAKTAFKSVDQYLASLPEPSRGAVKRVRAIVRKAIPSGQEGISYQIPTVRVGGAAAVYFAGWKQHYSLYPASAALVAAFAEDLEPFEVSKGTIRFPLARPVPAGLIARLVKFMAREAAARAKDKAAKSKRAR